MTTNFLELATTLKYLGAKRLPEKKLILRPLQVSFLERGENINRKFLKIWEDEGGSMVILIPRGRTDLFVSTKNCDLWTFPEVVLP